VELFELPSNSKLVTCEKPMHIEDGCFVKITSLCGVNSMKLYVDVYVLSKPYFILTRVYIT